MKSFTTYALEGFPMIESGDDIAQITVDVAGRNGLRLETGDIIVVAQKIFSKAEARVIELRDIAPSKKAREIAKEIGKGPKFVQLVLEETEEILKASREVFLVEDKRGLVCINAGIDKSNVKGRGNFTLLPKNPNASARDCRARIKELTGKDVAVVVSDTYSRPFRRGQVNFAIGSSGIKAFKDYRGKRDLYRHILKVKNVAVVDEVAAAAELLMGQAREAVPVIILRGLADITTSNEKCNTDDLRISREEDLFRQAL